jgi:hypothetical protein
MIGSSLEPSILLNLEQTFIFPGRIFSKQFIKSMLAIVSWQPVFKLGEDVDSCRHSRSIPKLWTFASGSHIDGQAL